MSKIKFTGKNEEDAVQKAADALNIKRNEVKFEIISRASGLLGLLGQTVTIEVTVGERQEPKQKDKPKPRQERPRDRQPEKKAERKPEKKAERKPEKKAQKKTEKKTEKKAVKKTEKRKPVEVDEKVFEEKQHKALEVMQEMLAKMESKATVAVGREKDEIILTIQGQLPEWFGRGHSRVADSVQFILNKIINRFPPRYRVVLNLEAQKEQREKELDEMTSRLMDGIRESGHSVWILPMSPRDRRLVHMSVAKADGVDSKSVGYGPTRRLCLYKVD